MKNYFSAAYYYRLDQRYLPFVYLLFFLSVSTVQAIDVELYGPVVGFPNNTNTVYSQLIHTTVSNDEHASRLDSTMFHVKAAKNCVIQSALLKLSDKKDDIVVTAPLMVFDRSEITFIVATNCYSKIYIETILDVNQLTNMPNKIHIRVRIQ